MGSLWIPPHTDVELDVARIGNFCRYCMRENDHNAYCCVGIELAAKMAIKRKPSQDEAIADVEQQAKHFADAWADDYCVEALQYRLVADYLRGEIQLAHL